MKILFKIVDYLSAVVMGVGTVYLVSLAVGKDWHMFLAMIAGMVIGMGVLLLSLVVFTYFSTPFEIIPKGMIITMATGMASGMAAAADGQWPAVMMPAAVLFSLCTQLCIDLYNVKLSGEVTIDDGRH